MRLKTAMLKASQITEETSKRHVRYVIAHAVAMTVVVAAAMLIMAGCERKPVLTHSRFKHLPEAGWHKSLPLSFKPEYDDSTRAYDLALALRHDNSYPYRNLSLVMDVITADSSVNRQTVDIALADEYGNWLGGGFGALYQQVLTIARGVKPDEANTVVVWQEMEGCDTLRGLTDVGIIATPR